jgi:hypothetical protein
MLDCDSREKGSIPFNRERKCSFILSLNSSVVEHWTENPRVVGSIPTLSKKNKNKGIF